MRSPSLTRFTKIQKILIRIVASFLFFYYLLPYAIPLGLRDLPHSTIIYDTHGQEIGEIVNNKAYRHVSLKYEEFPEFLKTIVVAIEDKRFRKHDGIDRLALARAFQTNRNNKKIVQ
jgi:membrane peptidoglycan carboxypeptidase